MVQSKLAGYSKSGRVWINPHVPSGLRQRLRRHETVEIALRRQGLSYREAHKRALKAEHKGMTQRQISVYEGRLGAVARHKPVRR